MILSILFQNKKSQNSPVVGNCMNLFPFKYLRFLGVPEKAFVFQFKEKNNKINDSEFCNNMIGMNNS